MVLEYITDLVYCLLYGDGSGGNFLVSILHVETKIKLQLTLENY